MANPGLKYLKFFWKAGNEHSVHSPFIFSLYTEEFKHRGHYYAYDSIEALRQELLDSTQTITVTDYGAGSRIFKSNERPVAGIAQHVLKPAKYGQLLFRLVNRFQPKTILELGTSLGISTLYLAKANSKAQVFTLEGCPETLEVAKQVFEKNKTKNITAIEGKFSDTLPGVLKGIEKLDFAFIDGHHSEQPTLDYFEMCLQKVHEDSVLIFDDIHWSSEMEAAWEAIKKHPEVQVTIDLFQFGIVFFRKVQAREHFRLRF